MNEYTIKDIEVGLTASFEKAITQEMENEFRRITGDENPLHQDDQFAREISNGKFERHATFGMLTASLYSTMAGMYLPGKYSLIHSFEELSFLNPMYVDDIVTVVGEVIDKNEALGLIRIKAVIKNSSGKLISKARMKILVMK